MAKRTECAIEAALKAKAALEAVGDTLREILGNLLARSSPVSAALPSDPTAARAMSGSGAGGKPSDQSSECRPVSSDGIQKPLLSGRVPSLPREIRIYAVGDIHGRLDLLDRLLAQIDDDIATRPVIRPVFVFLGDYLDRGPSSSEVIDRLLRLAADRECVFLKGNHEQLAIRCLSDPDLFRQWIRIGGRATLLSYGVSGVSPRGSFPDEKQTTALQAAFNDALPQNHRDFFRDLQISFACGDFFFTHAGVRPGIDLSQQQESDLLWIRNEFLSSDVDFGGIVIHGHTPTDEIEVRMNRINIDTRAFATGRLTSLVIENTSLSIIDTVEASVRRDLNCIHVGERSA